jgi:predicted MFS family arabinose efflux permease
MGDVATADLSPRPASEWRRGWRVAVAAAVGMGVGTGLLAFLAGLFIGPLQAEFGWTRGQIAFASLFHLAAVVLMPFLGRIVDRYGARPTALIALTLWSCAFLGLASMSGALWQFYAIQAFMAVVGLATSVVVFTRPVAAWFDKGRGSALGFAIAGTSMTSIVLYPILQAVIATFGWRVGYLFIGALPIVVGLPLIWRWLSPAPAEAARAPGGAAHVLAGASFGEAARDARFWLLLVAMFAGNIPVGGILNQLQPLLTDKGFDPAIAAMMGSLFAASVALGRIGGGFLLDRWPPSVVVIVCLSAPILGAALMLISVPPLWIAMVAVVTFGVAQGTEADFLAFFIARYFGLRSYATIYGALMAVAAASLSIGVLVYAGAHDAFGSYAPALILQMGLMAFTATMLVLCERLSGRRMARAAQAAAAQAATPGMEQ